MLHLFLNKGDDMTASCCSCTAQTELWAVSNTNAAPIKYVPFLVCDGHLQQMPELKNAFIELCKARFDQVKGDKIQSEQWVLEKVAGTWRVMDSRECSDCERTDQIWLKIKHGIDKDDGYPNTEYQYICDGHLSRKKETTPLGKDLHPIECTW